MRKDIEDRLLEDGIYDVTDIQFILADDDTTNHFFSDNKQIKNKQVLEFINSHKDFVIASAYETNTVIFLAVKPVKLDTEEWKKENLFGYGFNYGSTNIIKNCPKTILILAEND